MFEWEVPQMTDPDTFHLKYEEMQTMNKWSEPKSSDENRRTQL